MILGAIQSCIRAERLIENPVNKPCTGRIPVWHARPSAQNEQCRTCYDFHDPSFYRIEQNLSSLSGQVFHIALSHLKTAFLGTLPPRFTFTDIRQEQGQNILGGKPPGRLSKQMPRNRRAFLSGRPITRQLAADAVNPGYVQQTRRFCLGCRASRAYGYPLGPSLVTEICQYSDNVDPFGKLGVAEQFRTLKYAIRTLDHSSIDRVMETRKDLWDIGRLAIATHLMGCENVQDLSLHGRKLTPADPALGRWYGQLFELLTPKSPRFELFAKIPVTFVTFNYDRSFDFFFWQWLQEKYREPKDNEAIHKYLLDNPIIHVHGQLGKLAFQLGAPVEKIEFGKYSSSREPGLVERAAKGIKIVHDTELDTSSEFEQARSKIAKAVAIVILGFGYDDVNFRRLGMDTVDQEERLHYFTTAYGVDDGGRERIRAMCGTRSGFIGGESQGIREFLNQHWVQIAAFAR